MEKFRLNHKISLVTGSIKGRHSTTYQSPGRRLGQVWDQCECRRTGFYPDRFNPSVVEKRGIQYMVKMENSFGKMGEPRRFRQCCSLSGVIGI
jgi:hypothetical protein